MAAFQFPDPTSFVVKQAMHLFEGHARVVQQKLQNTIVSME